MAGKGKQKFSDYIKQRAVCPDQLDKSAHDWLKVEDVMSSDVQTISPAESEDLIQFHRTSWGKSRRGVWPVAGLSPHLQRRAVRVIASSAQRISNGLISAIEQLKPSRTALGDWQQQV